MKNKERITMKYASLFLIFFLCFAAVDGFCFGGLEKTKPGKVKDPSANEAKLSKELEDTKQKLTETQASLKKANEDVAKLQQQVGVGKKQENKLPLVPVTGEIIAQAVKYKIDLDGLDYYLSMSLVLMLNNQTDVVPNDGGGIRLTEKNTQKRLEIPAGTIGKKKVNSAQDKLGGNRKSFEIAFPDKSDPNSEFFLEFVRNDRDNTFDLNSVKSEGIVYEFTFDKLKPQLCVYYEYIFDEGSQIVVQGRTSGTVNNNAKSQPDVQLKLPVEEDRSSSGSKSSRSRSSSGRSRNVIDDGSLCLDSVARFISSRNRNEKLNDIKELLLIYEDEAKREGVNYDIAVAQMCRATNYLNIKNNYNYAGLSPEGTGGRSIQFKNKKDGVRSHIQHLKAYASKAGPREPIVNPRHEILGKLGLYNSVETFDDLYSKWAPQSSKYGNAIDDILDLLYQASE